MGITGLHKFLRPVTKHRAKIADYRGQKVGVDAMCWMHRGAVASAFQLMFGQDTAKFINFFAKMISVLLFNDIEPIIVFDGASTPAKDEESSARRKAREKCRDEAMELHRQGATQHDVHKKCVGGIQVTHDMTQRVMEMLIMIDVKFIVAPYEADAQLAYMCRGGELACVITEDSDLLVYGCPRIFCKMSNEGEGELIDIENVFGAALRSGEKPEESSIQIASENQQPNGDAVDEGQDAVDKESNASLNLMRNWTEDMFVLMCVLVGCDYLRKEKRISGLGPVTLVKYISNYKTTECLLRALYADKKWTSKFPCHVDEYLIDIEKTFAAFQHHVVLKCRRMEDVRMSELNGAPPPERFDVETICGKLRTDRELIRKVAMGQFNIKTMQPCSPSGLLKKSEKEDIWTQSDYRKKELRDKAQQEAYEDLVDPNKLHFKYLGEVVKPVDEAAPAEKGKYTMIHSTPVVQHKACSILDDIIRSQKRNPTASSTATTAPNLDTPSRTSSSSTDTPNLSTPGSISASSTCKPHVKTAGYPSTSSKSRGKLKPPGSTSASSKCTPNLDTPSHPSGSSIFTPATSNGRLSLLADPFPEMPNLAEQDLEMRIDGSSPGEWDKQLDAPEQRNLADEAQLSRPVDADKGEEPRAKKKFFLGGKRRKVVVAAETEVDTRNVNCSC